GGEVHGEYIGEGWLLCDEWLGCCSRPSGLGQDKREATLAVEPPLERSPAASAQQHALAAAVELVAVFGVDRLSFGHAESATRHFELDGLGRSELHLDACPGIVPARDVVPRVGRH